MTACFTPDDLARRQSLLEASWGVVAATEGPAPGRGYCRKQTAEGKAAEAERERAMSDARVASERVRLGERDRFDALRQFVADWYAADDFADLVRRTGLDARACSNLAVTLRRMGVELPKLRRRAAVQTGSLSRGQREELRRWALFLAKGNVGEV